MSDDNNAVCPNAVNCELFEVFRVAGALGIWKLSYCEADYTRCSRYELHCAGQPVPRTLLPNGESLRVAGKTGSDG